MIDKLLRSDCPHGFDCPKVYRLSDGRLAVQGDPADAALLAEAGVPAHENMVIVSAALFPELSC